jgi:iron complex outermembrane receptor protein
MYQPCPLTGLAAAMALCMLGFGACFAAEANPEAGNDPDLTELSLQDLMSIEVTSVSKKAEPQKLAPAAIYVLTAEDIRRSGATTVPEVLRTVPGVNVAKLNAHTWSITVRGFSGEYSNKLLVLVDGRSVYTPFFSGVYWETLNLVMDDIERIEVIRGPGGALWGANAVNGVINIITKSAKETPGGLLSLGSGTEEHALGRFRYGGQLGNDIYYRIYMGYSDYDDGQFQSGKTANDEWDALFGGFRIDFVPDGSDTITISGQSSRNDLASMLELPTRIFPFSERTEGYEDLSRHNLTLRWTRELDEDSRFQFQAYYDDLQLDGTTILVRERAFDLDFQYQTALGDRHDLVWGTGFRYVTDQIGGTSTVSVDPDERRLRIFNGYLQDEISLLDDTLRLTLVAKLEYNDYSGIEIQPNARVRWSPNEKHTLWAAASRAVRSPSRVERDGRIESNTTRRLAVSLYGNQDFESENVLALEAGYRVQLAETAALDLSIYHNHYDDLRTLEFRRPFLELIPPPLHLAIPVVGDNNMEGSTYGFELAMDWRPQPWWRMRAGYSYLEMDLSLHPETFDILSGGVEDETAEQQFFMQHSFDLPRNVEFDATLRYVDAIPAFGVEDYLTMDIRLAWLPREDLEFSLVGQNLFDDSHLEHDSSFVTIVPTEVERGVYGKVTWRF